MKVLILSCNTGGGHNTAAKAIKEVFDSCGDECEVKDALSFGGQRASDLVCDAYVEMVKKTPELFGMIYKMGTKVGPTTTKYEHLHSPIYLVNKIYADALEDYIEEKHIQVVICCHFFAAMAMTHLNKRHNLKTPFYFVATDYYASPMIEETKPKKIFIAHKDSAFTYTAKGISGKTLIPTGIPIAQKFVRPGDKKTARAKLNIPDDSQVFLLMSGSMGFGDTIDIARYIFDNGNDHTRVIAITGNNKELAKEFLSSFPTETRLEVVGFTSEVDIYMEASDVLLSKPGGLSSTEALVKGIPIVHTSPIPGCESENVQFFTEHNLSVCAQGAKEAGRLAHNLMNDQFLRTQMSEAQKHYRCENSAKAIVDYIKREK